MAEDRRFTYVAIDSAGRRSRGALVAHDDATAFEQLRREGLTPLSLKLSAAAKPPRPAAALGDKESAEFLSSLAELLKAGADIRTALSILSARFERPAVRAACERLTADIGGGDPLDVAFSRAFQRRQPFVAPMVAAGEAAGDLPGGLQRAAEVIQSRLKLQAQLVSVMAYPGFVFVSSIGALLVILLFIVPSIAPLAQDMGAEPPPALGAMIAASDFLSANLALLGAGLIVLLVGLLAAWRLGLLEAPLEGLMFDGPARRTIGGIVFGGFAISLGTMLSAGAPIGEALRLAIRATPAKGARRRLEPVSQAVRQGEFLSDALAKVRGFPPAIVRLTAVGEASNTVGPLLMRSGKMAEDGALARIETLGRIAGPALIIMLGALLGVLMAGLLSGVSQLGQPVLD